MGDPTRGLYDKFTVHRNDDTDLPGRKHDGCEYFVLDLDHDPHAAPALEAYAASCEKDYPLLARDLRKKALEIRDRIEYDKTVFGDDGTAK
jgi:hypothetical protein